MNLRNSASWSVTRVTTSDVPTGDDRRSSYVWGGSVPFRTRNRVAVRIYGRPPEHLVDPVDEAFRHGVLEPFSFVMHFAPVHPENLNEELLDEPMAPENEGCQLFAGRGEPNPHVRLITNQPGLGQRLDHRGGGPRHNSQRCSNLAHGDQRAGVVVGGLRDVDRLEVVLDGLRREHGP